MIVVFVVAGGPALTLGFFDRVVFVDIVCTATGSANSNRLLAARQI
jgi:hypothetical protein